MAQVPSRPASAQERQAPLQLDPQQTPCWHSPEAHSAALAQATPSAFFEQTPALQTLGLTQSPSAAQVVRHWPFAAQRYAPQEAAVTVWQTPAPLQLRGGV